MTVMWLYKLVEGRYYHGSQIFDNPYQRWQILRYWEEDETVPDDLGTQAQQIANWLKCPIEIDFSDGLSQFYYPQEL